MSITIPAGTGGLGYAASSQQTTANTFNYNAFTTLSLSSATLPPAEGGSYPNSLPAVPPSIQTYSFINSQYNNGDTPQIKDQAQCAVCEVGVFNDNCGCKSTCLAALLPALSSFAFQAFLLDFSGA